MCRYCGLGICLVTGGVCLLCKQRLFTIHRDRAIFSNSDILNEFPHLHHEVERCVKMNSPARIPGPMLFPVPKFVHIRAESVRYRAFSLYAEAEEHPG